MILSQKALDELKAIHKKHFNEDLTDEEAMAMGNRLLRLFSVLLRPAETNRDAKPSEEQNAPEKAQSTDRRTPTS